MKFADLLKLEIKRQQETINLIPSENYPSRKILQGLATIFATKYAEGYPGKRYYPGNNIVDLVENKTKALALKLYGLDETKWHVNVQSYSGSQANFEIYSSLLNAGDKILSLKLNSGGHLSHGHKVTFAGKIFTIIQYDVNHNGILNYGQIEKLARQFQPKLIISGFTAYPRLIDFKKISEIAHAVGALHLADISHIAGLVAANLHPSPFPEADFVMHTTHKTLRGPRGAIILCRKEFSQKLDRAVFPGLQGGPHIHTIYAIGLCLEESLTKSFKNYAKQILDNRTILEQELKRLGFEFVSGGSDNHLLLINLKKLNLDGFTAEKLLERANIIANRNTIPDDESPFYPSGLRIGTPALTSRGLKTKEMKLVAQFIYRVLVKKDKPESIKKEVSSFIKKFKIPSL